jgi:Rrf2 family protein
MDLAQHYGQRAVLSSEISARQGIPEPFLDQLLATLRKAGLVNSRRGPQGGHYLAKAPAEITLAEVVTALEGAPSHMECVEEPGVCLQSTACALREVWQEIDRSTQEVLQGVSIGTLAQQQQRRERKGTYYI